MEFHYTSTSRNGGIWSFECNCGYKIVYNSDLPTPTLTVETFGNITARHTSASQKPDDKSGLNIFPADPLSPNPIYQTETSDQSETEIIEIGPGALLPRYLIVKIENILGNFAAVLIKEGFNLKPSIPSY